jgi:predicted methyltransferase MtxX (methanogen marker protein 4)
MRKISKTFEVRVRRLSLLALPDWSFFLAPVGIDEGDSISDRLNLAVQGAKYLESMGVEAQVSILSGGRLEDLGRSDRVDRTSPRGNWCEARPGRPGSGRSTGGSSSRSAAATT